MKKLICAVTVLAVSTAQATTIHVDADNCPGPGSGTVRDPYCAIQTAIDNAVDTDEIVVAPGTYFETINFLGKAIWLRSSGGAEVTIIDGTGNFHVVQCVSGEGPDTLLSGFTITGGDANGSSLDQRGGGMINNASDPTVTNCTFSDNMASSSGGGMYNLNSSPTVTGCTFSGNTSFNGGGMSSLNRRRHHRHRRLPGIARAMGRPRKLRLRRRRSGHQRLPRAAGELGTVPVDDAAKC